MGITTQLINGAQDLADQERALNFLEQATFAKVIAYSKTVDAANKTTPNQAVLQDVPIGEQPGPLVLVSLAIGADATQAISAKLTDGKIVVFHDTAYVSGKEQLILGFR